MAKITYEIPEEWVEHLAAEFGYQDKIQEPKVITRNGTKEVEYQQIDNPKTKLEYIEDVLKDRIVSQVKSRIGTLKSMEIQKELDSQIKVGDIKKVK